MAVSEKTSMPCSSLDVDSVPAILKGAADACWRPGGSPGSNAELSQRPASTTSSQEPLQDMDVLRTLWPAHLIL